jgi:hypothetical protein
MNDDLPPLPLMCDGVGDYTADQMRAYARAALAAAVPAQPAEPVAQIVTTEMKAAGAQALYEASVGDLEPTGDEIAAAYKAMVAAQAEPVAWPTEVQPNGSVWPVNPDDMQPLTLSDEQVWNSEEIMAINARAGLQMPVLMELVRAVLAAAQGEKP